MLCMVVRVIMKVMADCCTLCQILRSYHDANHACPKRKHENSGPEFPGFSFNMVFPQKKVPELAQQATTWDWAFLTFKTTRLEKTVFYCFAHFCGTNQGEDPNWVGSHLGPIWILYATQKKNGSLCSCRPRHSGSTGLPSPGKTWSGGLKPALLSIVWLGM